MFRTLLCSALALAGLALALVTSPTAQGPTPVPSIWLQGTSPGIPQTGHTNISGTAIAGLFQGGGSGLTGLNATNITTGTLNAGRLPVPLNLTGSVIGGTIRSENTLANGIGIVGLASSSSGQNYGGLFVSDGTTGFGVYAQSAGLYGVYSQCSGFCGVSGSSTAASGASYGGYFESSSTSGVGVFGRSYAVSGTTYGGVFQSESPSGYGLVAVNVAGGVGIRGKGGLESGLGADGNAVGVWGDTNPGNGVLGTTGNGTGVLGRSTSGFGLFGLSEGGYGMGVYGLGPVYGVYSNGNSGASGTKSFRIDHPLDPENKWLLHYSSEGPEPLNVYSGNVVTDARGYANVALPDYFDTINKDFRYQLTVIDDGEREGFVLVKVVNEIAKNSFRIRTSVPHVKVSWRVEATRNDLWVQKKGAPVEIDKQDRDRGKYQVPELYGEPREQGAFFRETFRVISK